MRFTSYSANLQSNTRATSLTQGFLVSCWKAFADAKQQTVMDKYEVQYQKNDWYGTSAWNYIGEPSAFYQTQIERYWDYSSFPYRFHAITPCPAHADISGFTLNGQQLTIPNSVTFSCQTAASGNLSKPTAEAEPYLVAQVSRDGQGRDLDLVVKDANGNPKEINNTSGTSLNRSVALPFHHLTSKVRFGIYTDDGSAIDDDTRITNVSIKVVSSGFVTELKGYSADLTTGSMMGGSFGPQTTTDAGLTLITTTSDTDDKSLLKNCTKPSTAYMCQAPDGLLQLPQQNVQMTVTLTIGDVTYVDEPVALVLADGTITDSFTWDQNTIYTYYIILKRLDPRPIEYTCTLEPWDDISGSLSTDLEK